MKNRYYFIFFKKILLIAAVTIFSFYSSCRSAFSPDYYNGSRQVLSYGDSAVVFNTMRDKDGRKRLRKNRLYFYYNLQEIHSTRGAFAGIPLDEQYVKQSIDGRLIEKGVFKGGLKHGRWRRWSNDGELKFVEHWRNGRGIKRKKVFDDAGEIVGVYRWKDNNWVLTKRFLRKQKRAAEKEKVLNREDESDDNDGIKGKIRKFFSFLPWRQKSNEATGESEKKSASPENSSRNRKKQNESLGNEENDKQFKTKWLFGLFKKKEREKHKE